MTSAMWRRLIAVILAITLCVASYFAIRWVWRDITYWSRSTTVAYETDTLEQCVRIAIADWPRVSATFSGPLISLQVPAQEGVIVKDTPTPQVARIVVYGHSDSISYLGPSSEDAVMDLLRQISHRMSLRCDGA